MSEMQPNLTPDPAEPDFQPGAKWAAPFHASEREHQDIAPASKHPSAASLLLSTFLSLVVVLVLLMALRTLLPSMLESSRYSWYRGQLRAEYEVAGQQLERVSLDGIPNVSQTVARRVCPSVVHITLDQLDSSSLDIDGEGAIRSGAKLPRRPMVGQGSGVIVDSRGYILTNYHVINDEEDRMSRNDRINVYLADERTCKAELIGFDSARDLAVLKIEANDLMPITWGDSECLDVGAPVWAVGSPFGLTGSITFGILSGKHRLDLSGTSYERRFLGDSQRNGQMNARYTDLMQSDVAVNPGNSGGPLVNGRGELIGINTAIIGEAYRGVSFSIPSSIAKIVFDKIVESGSMRPGWLGVQLVRVSEWQQLLAAQNNPLGFVDGIEEPSAKTIRAKAPLRGAVVRELVGQDSPAAIAGLRVGDWIQEIDNHPVKGVEDLIFAIGKTSVGSKVQLTIERNGHRNQIDVVIGERPDIR